MEKVPPVAYRRLDMSTADLIGVTYLAGLALCVILSACVGTWRGVQKYDPPRNDWEDFGMALFGCLSVGVIAGVLWPLAGPAALAAVPAWRSKLKKEHERNSRLELSEGLYQTALSYPVDTPEYRMLMSESNKIKKELRRSL